MFSSGLQSLRSCFLAVGGDQFLSHHELRPSVGPVLNPYPHTTVCVRVCVYQHKAEAYAYACICMCVVSSLCPVYFSSPAILRLPSTTLAILSQPNRKADQSNLWRGREDETNTKKDQ